MNGQFDLVKFRSMPARRVTVYDIAEKLGVSHATVSLALRNHPGISKKRREQVKKIADEMGYAPDPHLAALAAYRRANTPAEIRSAIAWINHWEQPEQLRKLREFDLYWRGAAQAAKRFGYHLEEIRWTPDYSAKRFEQILLTRGIRGVLIPPHNIVPDWGDFDWSKFSIIRFGLSVSSPDSHLVTADQLRAVLMAVKKMAEYGYRHIGFVVPADGDRRLGGGFVGGVLFGGKILQPAGDSALADRGADLFRTSGKSPGVIESVAQENQTRRVADHVAGNPGDVAPVEVSHPGGHCGGGHGGGCAGGRGH